MGAFSNRAIGRTLLCLLPIVSMTFGDILRNEDAMNRAFQIGRSLEKLENVGGISDYVELFSELLEEMKNDIASRAEQALQQGLAKVQKDYNVSSLCLNHTKLLFEGLVERQDWAFRMIDAMGKPHSGVLNGHLSWIGGFDECIAITAMVNTSNEISHPFKGRYCLATFAQPAITDISLISMGLKLGLCMPDSCSNNDTIALLNTTLSTLLPMNTSRFANPTVNCQLRNLKLDTKSIIVIIVTSVFGLLMLTATLYDIVITHWLNKIPEKIQDDTNMPGESERVPPFSAEKQIASNENNSPVVSAVDLPNGVDDELATKDRDVTKKKEACKPGLFAQVLLSFSVYTNGAKILNTNQPPGTLTAINGIRFISMTWVIMGHTFGDSLQIAENVATFLPGMIKRFTFQAIANATVSVDTFFTLRKCAEQKLHPLSYTDGDMDSQRQQDQHKSRYVPHIICDSGLGAKMSVLFACLIKRNLRPYVKSNKKLDIQKNPLNETVLLSTQNIRKKYGGLLVAYLGLKALNKTGGAKKFNWGMFYFHRFWRLTPPYMFFLMFYVCLLKYMADGPMWPQQGTEIKDCENTWWRNMLYINNLYDVGKQCMGWGWYLANDMQFYVLSPLMLIPLFYSKWLGSLSCSIFLLVSIISSGVISSTNNFSANMMFGKNLADQYEKMYVKPWCRIGPYAVGMFAGYILYRTQCKIKIPKIFNLIGWASATAIALLVLYGLYDESGVPNLDNNVAAFYNAMHRSVWGLAVCWVIVACATGHGGFVNTLLSWKAFVPLSRLTYCAYLVHLPVLDVFDRSKRSLIYFSDLEEIYLFLGTVVMAYAVAFVVSLTFESPMMGLEKALLGRKKNS